MVNLIPEKERKQIRREYRARFILAGSFLATGVALFTLLALSPSFGSLFITRPAAIAAATIVEQGKTESADIARAQTLILQLSPVAAASSSVSVAIQEALSLKPAGVHIDNITYTTFISPTIALEGVTDTRLALDAFRTALQKNPHFKKVRLPVGDLVGSSGGRFTISLDGNF